MLKLENVFLLKEGGGVASLENYEKLCNPFCRNIILGKLKQLLLLWTSPQPS